MVPARHDRHLPGRSLLSDHLKGLTVLRHAAVHRGCRGYASYRCATRKPDTHATSIPLLLYCHHPCDAASSIWLGTGTFLSIRLTEWQRVGDAACRRVKRYYACDEGLRRGVSCVWGLMAGSDRTTVPTRPPTRLGNPNRDLDVSKHMLV